jgi:hypothetical protein
MKRLLRRTNEALRLASLGLFQLLVLFWVAKAYYCARGYLTAGRRGALGALMRGTPIPDDPKEWGHPRWDLLLLRLAGIAAMTVLLGALNRRSLGKLWRQLRNEKGMPSGRTGTHI